MNVLTARFCGTLFYGEEPIENVVLYSYTGEDDLKELARKTANHVRSMQPGAREDSGKWRVVMSIESFNPVTREWE